MLLTRVLHGVEILETRGSVDHAEISSVVFDSSDARPGSLFVCLVGSTSDGHDYALAAAQGASALLCERILSVDIPQVRVADTRVAMAYAAAALEGSPADALTMIGVTGTNGKTTTAHLLAAILQEAGKPTATIGTLTGARTTPEAPLLQRQLAEARDGRVEVVSMEVSSHAIVQHRVDAIVFDVAVFTNLTQDHLDYHHTMDEYFEAKARLFTAEHAKCAVVNADDDYGRRLIDRTSIPVTAFSPSQASDVRFDIQGSQFRWDGLDVRLPLGGEFNVANAIAAAATARELGVSDADIVSGLASGAAVPGRFQMIQEGQPFAVVIDYAHTPDALEKLLLAARAMVGAEGRVIAVFGCGGDRDRTKRPAMGDVAIRLADLAIVTSDNPRSEDPKAILAEVVGDHTDGLAVEEDRARAIDAAVRLASAGDVVVIAGKGHETGQDFGDRVLPFDDRIVAEDALKRAMS